MEKEKVVELKSMVANILASGKYTHGIGRALRNLQKEIILYENFIQGRAIFERENKKFDFSKIQVGGGTHTLINFINIDIVPPADIIWDLRENFPIPNDSVELLFAEHFFEHVDYPTSAKKVMSEFNRVVRKNGRVILGVPDTELVAVNYVKRDKEYYNRAISQWYSNRSCLRDFNTYIDLLNYHMRDQDDDLKYNPHFWGYDFEKLKSLLINAGFSDVQPWKFDPQLANPKREWGSIYIIATK